MKFLYHEAMYAIFSICESLGLFFWIAVEGNCCFLPLFCYFFYFVEGLHISKKPWQLFLIVGVD